MTFRRKQKKEETVTAKVSLRDTTHTAQLVIGLCELTEKLIKVVLDTIKHVGHSPCILRVLHVVGDPSNLFRDLTLDVVGSTDRGGADVADVVGDHGLALPDGPKEILESLVGLFLANNHGALNILDFAQDSCLLIKVAHAIPVASQKTASSVSCCRNYHTNRWTQTQRYCLRRYTRRPTQRLLPVLGTCPQCGHTHLGNRNGPSEGLLEDVSGCRGKA